jgi:large subunit ribosomal protein L32e
MKNKMAIKFLRRGWYRYSKLGNRRKKKQVWRKPKGRDNKIREKRRGYATPVSVGFKKTEKEKTIIVKNTGEMKKQMKKVIFASVGKKKKIEMAKKAKELNLEVLNLNVDRFLKEIQKQNKKEKTKKNESKK